MDKIVSKVKPMKIQDQQRLAEAVRKALAVQQRPQLPRQLPKPPITQIPVPTGTMPLPMGQGVMMDGGIGNMLRQAITNRLQQLY